ncbi:MAG: cyclic nucleotide-binding domain-containing protein [Betaproteobacteria bacterium]|jgi:CRP-like cAMP-binding protein|nr:cyclic nucleotide-binding domain-containing protein [Betaproteobacteria bacterium]
MTPTEVAYPAASLLFRKGDPAKAFYVLQSGRVALFNSALQGYGQAKSGPQPSPAKAPSLSSPALESALAILAPGDSFGEQAILSGGVRSVSAWAIEPTVCLEITADGLRNMLDNQPGLLKPLIEALLLQLYMKNEFRSIHAPDFL